MSVCNCVHGLEEKKIPIYCISFFFSVDGLRDNVTVNVTSSSCLQSITCVSSIDGYCVVYIGSNRTDALNRTSFNGSTNQPIQTSGLDFGSDDYYVAQFNITELIKIDGRFYSEGNSIIFYVFI